MIGTERVIKNIIFKMMVKKGFLEEVTFKQKHELSRETVA